jgi:hypothetical protein
MLIIHKFAMESINPSKNKQSPISMVFHYCRNSRFWLTKTRAYKGAGQKGSLRVTSHAPRSAKECENVNPHTPKWIPILGVQIPNGFLNFQKAIIGVKIHWITTFIIIGKLLECSKSLKWARMTHLDIWNTSYD